MDQPGKVANAARGQLNRKNENFPVPVWARESSLARWARPFRPASACSFSSLKLNLVLTLGIPPDARGGVQLFIPPAAIGSVPSLSVTQLRTDGVHCQESAGTGSSVLKAVSVTGAAFSGITMCQLICASLFAHPLMVCNGHVRSIRKVP